MITAATIGFQPNWNAKKMTKFEFHLRFFVYIWVKIAAAYVKNIVICLPICYNFCILSNCTRLELLDFSPTPKKRMMRHVSFYRRKGFSGDIL